MLRKTEDLQLEWTAVTTFCVLQFVIIIIYYNLHYLIKYLPEYRATPWIDVPWILNVTLHAISLLL